jgi:hypothetical protein
MASFRSRRLETFLGAPLAEVGHTHVAGLVAARVSEAFDLDFKSTLYGRSDQDKRSLASDVAALANSAGGIIILGVGEDDQARATAAPGVPISDAEVRRIHQVVAALVAPMPVVEVVPVPGGSSGEHGYLIIAVPMSPARPHAVLVNEGMRFPRRNGPANRYLSEPEVAAAYRDRAARARSQDKRAAAAEKQIFTRLVSGIEEQYWVVVSLVPDVPGELLIGHHALTAVRTDMLGKFPLIIQPSNFSWHRAEVGRRRLQLSGSPHSGPAFWLAADLHDDGTGAFAVNAADIGNARKPNQVWMHDEQIVNGILTGLRFLARHARDRAMAGGGALIRARLYPIRHKQRFMLGTGTRTGDAREGHLLYYRAGHVAESAAPLDVLADDGPGLVSAAYLLATDIFQEFGMPEAMQLTRDGELYSHYWGDGLLPSLRAWAKEAGITITDAEIPPA